MASKGMTWDPAADRKLLLGILKTQNVTVDYEAMATYMTTEDQACTVSAIKNRVKKLKALSKEADTGGDEEEGTPKSKATPRKRGGGAGADGESPTKKTKATPKRKDAKAKNAEVEDADDDEESSKVKKEDDEGDEMA